MEVDGMVTWKTPFSIQTGCELHVTIVSWEEKEALTSCCNVF